MRAASAGVLSVEHEDPVWAGPRTDQDGLDIAHHTLRRCWS